MFALVREKVAAKLLLVGDGPERQRMENICREFGLCDEIRFLGKLDAVEELLSVCDLFVMPSEKESFGLAALEAMACEVPVISSNTGGLPELIQQGVCGFMSPVGDVEDMAKNALTILQDDNLPAFKAAALKRAKDFDIHQILPLYEAYYERIGFQSKAVLA
jgi:N-acetyl-alpha-D-glucosaminyl L-malate synthase BshA